MKAETLQSAAILIGALAIAAAIYFRPPALSAAPGGEGNRYQAVAVDGFIYVIDTIKGQPSKIIPTK